MPLLVTFARAAEELSLSPAELRRLIAEGYLKPHPVLAKRIAFDQIQKFAYYDNPDAETDRRPEADTESGQPLDAGTPAQEWGIPPLRLRQNP